MQCNHYYQEISACHCLKVGYACCSWYMTNVAAIPPDSYSHHVILSHPRICGGVWLRLTEYLSISPTPTSDSQ